MIKAKNIAYKCLLLLSSCSFAIGVFAKSSKLSLQEQPLITVLETLEEKYHIHFSYNPVELYDVAVNFEFDASETVEAAIERLLSPTRFHYESFGEQFYVIYEKSNAGHKDVRKLRKHWKEIQKLERKGNISLHKNKKNGNDQLNSALSRYSKMESARWSFGTVRDAETKETLIGTNIIIKNTNIGTASDLNGNFSLNATRIPPYELLITYTGYPDKLVKVTKENRGQLDIFLSADGVLLNQVVVGASRHSERFVEAPVTVEKLDILALQSSSAEGVFESMSNLKGIQIIKGSISGAVMNTRGFANMNNLRFLMHLDGMDVTSPGFGVYSNTGGVSVLDMQSVEVIPGSSSALYGANAFNGILLMHTKDPFIHQGLGVHFKTGITRHSISGANPYNNVSVRYAKAFGDKLALKIDYETLLTKDWVAEDFTQRDRSIDPFIPADKNPPLVNPNQANYDAVTIHGDKDAEVFTQVVTTGEPLFSSDGQTLTWNQANVHRTGYTESELFNSAVSNHRINLGLSYKIKKDWRIDYTYKYAVQDLVLRHTTNYPFYDFNLQHHKVEVKGKGLTARWYHNSENAKNTWSASYLAASIQTQLLSNADWKQRFVDAYVGEIEGVNATSIVAARTYADAGMAAVGSLAWKTARNVSINSPTTYNPNGVIGAKLAENSSFWHADVLYDFEEKLNPSSSWKILIGSSFRKYNVNSLGAFFNDNRLKANESAGHAIGYAGTIPLSEAGIFGQVAKKILDNRLKLSFVGRANYHSNFKLNFTPQLAAVFSPDPKSNHNFRLSFTTGVRNPGLQEQYINFLISPTHVILGGTMDNLDNYYDPFLQITGQELQEIFQEQLGYEHKGLQPERNTTYETGYKGLLMNDKLLIDVNAYFTHYKNFVERANLTITTQDGTPKIHALYANLENEVNAYGVGLGFEYALAGKYKMYTNYQFNDFKTPTSEAGFGFVVPAFNTPKNRINIGLNRRNTQGGFGFDVAGRYVSEYDFISTLGKGYIPAYFTMDTSLAYRFKNVNFILAASNLTGREYRTIYGGPTVGSIYTFSVLYSGDW